MTLVRQTLFESRSGGYYNYRIPGLCVTPRGTILAYCEARANDGGDHDVIDILLRRSADGGVTWSAPSCVADHAAFPATTMNNFICIPDAATGNVHALFCNFYRRGYHRVSRDDGQTWSDPIEITAALEPFRAEYDWKLLAFGPGHGIQHSSGRLIAPLWVSLGTDFHLPNRAGAVYSDDHGVSWKTGGLLPDTIPNCNEPAAVELSDGSVMINTRSHCDRCRRVVSISPSGAGGWSEPRFVEELHDPICYASILRYDRKTLLFANPNSLSRDLPGRWGFVCDRRNLTVRASQDDGRTWPFARVIESGPSGYSDLAVARDGNILCLYEDGMHERMSDPRRLTLARIPWPPTTGLRQWPLEVALWF